MFIATVTSATKPGRLVSTCRVANVAMTSSRCRGVDAGCSCTSSGTVSSTVPVGMPVPDTAPAQLVECINWYPVPGELFTSEKANTLHDRQNQKPSVRDSNPSTKLELGWVMMGRSHQTQQRVYGRYTSRGHTASSAHSTLAATPSRAVTHRPAKFESCVVVQRWHAAVDPA